MLKTAVKEGVRVLIAESSRYYVEGDDSNPKNIEGTVSYVGCSEEGLYIQVNWDNGLSNSYNNVDLDEVPASAKLRILLSRQPLVDGKEAICDFCVAEVEDVMNLPERIQSAGFMAEEGMVKSAMTRRWDSLATSFRRTENYPFIYVMKGEAMFQLVSKPNIVKDEPRTKQLEEGVVYRIVKPHRTLFAAGTLVTVDQQEPEGYVGALPYRLKKVNTTDKDWVGRDIVLEKV